MSTEFDSRTYARFVVVWIAILLPGCIEWGDTFGPSDLQSELVDVDDCTGDHDDYWQAIDDAVYIGGASEGASCNEMYYFSRGGGQAGGSDVFHLEPGLWIVDGSISLPAEPSVDWTVSTMDGDVLAEQSVEIYDYDVTQTAGARIVNSRVFIDGDAVGANVVLRAEMDLVDADEEVFTAELQAATLIVPE